MMSFKNNFFLFFLVTLLFNCSKNEEIKTITIKNTLNTHRSFETVELSKDFLKINSLSNIGIKDVASDQLQLTQSIDYNDDGTLDVIIFQPQIDAKSEKVFQIVTISEVERPKADTLCYSRFVPERTDDYAWENDKVAFRTFGPTAQKMVEDKIPGGTLTSGIDLWLKKVSYPIIDKWYAMNQEDVGYYHTDHGEGYDPYHVGSSRGTGGIGVWVNDTLLASKNFTNYRTIANGPLRTVFELDYEPWTEYGVKETKRISLDLGYNFSKFEIKLSSAKPVPNYAIGITLHDGKGDVIINDTKGVYGYWEEMDNAFLGEGVIIEKDRVLKAFDHRSSYPDQSQLLILTKVDDQSNLTYYAGFGWTGSGQFKNASEWKNFLNTFSQKMNNPMEVTLD